MFWYFLFCYMTFVKFWFGFWFLKIKVGFNFVKSLWIHGYEVFLTLVLISLELLMSANLLSFWLLCFAFRRIWYPITFCLEVAYVADWKKKKKIKINKLKFWILFVSVLEVLHLHTVIGGASIMWCKSFFLGNNFDSLGGGILI